MKRSKTSFAIAACLVFLPVAGTPLPAQAASTQVVAPEVQACVWEESNQEVASVTLNGRELVCFRAESGSGLAAEKAEDMAARLEEMLHEKKLDAGDLMPAKAGALAAIMCAGSTVLSFDTNLAIDATKETQPGILEMCLKVVNGIRTACGAPSLPASILKLTGQAPPEAAHAGGDTSFSGTASWYGGRFHGRRTSDGSRYDQDKLTAAHRTLPFGTKLLVMNRKTGNSCVVEINDRGPFVGDRVIDLSRAAARQLNMIGSGVALVDCLVLGNE